MSKAVTTKAESQVSTEVADLAAWGAPQPLGTDIVLSKILPMQSTSKLVQDGKAMFGEFRDSVTGEKLGSITEPKAWIPFHVQKFWDILEPNEAGSFKFVRMEPLIEDPTKPGYNDNLPWMDKVNGVETKRVRRMNFYMIDPNQVADGSAIPYILSFKSTSYKEGKKLYTQMYMRNRKVGLPPPGFTIVLAGSKQKNDDGSWIVPEYELGRKATPEEMKECLNWFQLINKGGVKVDDSDLESDTADTGMDPLDVMQGANPSGTGAF